MTKNRGGFHTLWRMPLAVPWGLIGIAGAAYFNSWVWGAIAGIMVGAGLAAWMLNQETPPETPVLDAYDRVSKSREQSGDINIRLTREEAMSFVDEPGMRQSLRDRHPEGFDIYNIYREVSQTAKEKMRGAL